jgi:O-antigen ligase
VAPPTVGSLSLDVGRKRSLPRLGRDGLVRASAVVAVAAFFGLIAGLDPILALGLIVGLGVLALLLTNLTAGLMVFTVVAFLESLPSVSGAPSIAKIVGLFLVLGWAGAVGFSRSDGSSLDFAARFPALVWVLALFLTWVLVSLLWAEDVGVARQTFFRYALNLVLFPIVFAAIREPRHVSWLYTVFIAGGLLGGFVGLQTVQSSDIPDERLSGAGLNPNELGALLAVAAVLATCLAVSRSSSAGARLIALAAALLSTLLVIMTESRGAMLGLTAAVLVTPFAAGRGRRAAAVGVALAAALSVAVWVTTAAPAQTRERLTQPTSSGSGRVDLWTVGLRMVKDEPITGVGAGNFPVSSVHYLLQPGAIARDEFIVDHPKVTHNIYLQVLAELGVIGLALFLALIGTCLACVLRAARTFRRQGAATMELLSRGLFIALVALLVADFFSSALYSKQLYLLLAMGPALLAMASPRRASTA